MTTSLLDAFFNGNKHVEFSDEYNAQIGKVKAITLDGRLKNYGRSSPMIKYGLLAAGEAISQSRLCQDGDSKVGIVTGILMGAQRSVEKYFASVFQENPAFASSSQFPMTTMNALGGQASIAYKIKGFNTTLAGSHSAFFYAVSLLRNGRQSSVITLSADEITPCLVDIYSLMGVTSMANQDHQGITNLAIGEAGGAILLETLEGSAARNHFPLAEVLGICVSQDGKLHKACRKGTALQRCMEKALETAQLEPYQIDAVVSNRSALLIHQKAESNALSMVFDHLPQVFRVDYCTGFCPSSGFVLGIIGAVGILQRMLLPSTKTLINGGTHGATCKLRENHEINHIMVICLSLTGESCAVILKRFRT